MRRKRKEGKVRKHAKWRGEKREGKERRKVKMRGHKERRQRKGTSRLHTQLHTHTSECDRGECGGNERGCGDKELRQWGGWEGLLLLLLLVVGGAGAGGGVSGLKQTGGCSSARFGVTVSSIPFVTRLYYTNAAQAGAPQPASFHFDQWN
ncbi:unnamed protein product [Pleuronectes platessa]|uniref:Uncharacterized protein n=1 Tax=Pleuronectes platessa TaxID=8262 RepID=A0A9N7TPK9_PLEPL|nr:unnamed protein product [Pleuronectes platessa]